MATSTRAGDPPSQAAGFSPDFLPKLGTVRQTGGRGGSLLSFLVQRLEDQGSAALAMQIADELKACGAAAQVDARELEADLRRLDVPPAELMARSPSEDPLEAIMYLTSVGNRVRWFLDK